MVTTAPALIDADEDAPLPRYPELVRLSLRLDRLLSTENEADAMLAARSLDYVQALTAELDRVRPRCRRRGTPRVA